MTTLLAFDTSGPHCAAAVLTGDHVVTRVDDMARGQAEHLMPMLEEFLAANGVVWRDLDGIGVGIGPGNFTGIRISVAAARGIALGLKKPAIGVSSLRAIMAGRPNAIACLHAPRGAYYVQASAMHDDHAPRMVGADLKEFPKTPAKAEAPLVGPAAAEIAAKLKVVSVVPPRYDMIEGIAWIAAATLGEGPPQPRPAPLYLRPADAAPPRDKAPVILT